MTADWTRWLAPDAGAQSTAPEVISFVQGSLPANYRSVLSPYDTARTLHRAVAKRLKYVCPSNQNDAVSVLKNGTGDCSGFAALLIASLRAGGIPARRICGFWEGTSAWHHRVEFHLPTTEWLVADPTIGNGADPTGTYAFGFGYSPEANTYLAMDTGDAHDVPGGLTGCLPIPTFRGGVIGTPVLDSFTYQSQLDPISSNSPPALSQGAVSPQSGPVSSSFQSSVVYADPDGDPPAYVQARVSAPDQSVGIYTMVLQPAQTSGDFSAGVTYQLTLGTSAHPIPGSYTVQFAATDGLSDPVTFSPGFQFVIQGAPVAKLSITSAANHNVQMRITQVPSQGSLIVQSSPDLGTWSPVKTNAAAGSTITLTLPINQTKLFFRVKEVP